LDIDKLKKILKDKGISNEKIDTMFKELSYYYERSFQMMEFMKKVPLNQEYYSLLSDIIPKEKFLIPSEKFVYPTTRVGTIQFDRHKDFLDLFSQMEKKLHQSDPDSTSLITEINRRFLEEMKDKVFFYRKWESYKPINLQFFKDKNKDNIEILFKEINILVGHSNSEIINFIKKQDQKAKRLNKGARYVV